MVKKSRKDYWRKYYKQYWPMHREQKIKYERKYRLKHKEELKETKRKYYQTNHERIEEYWKQRRAIPEVRERTKEWHKLYYENHKKQYNEQSKKWYKEHKKQTQEYLKRWYLAHPIKAKIINARRNHKRRGLKINKIWNSWFEGAHLHHFTKHDGIWMPTKVHKSVSHNIWTGKNMIQINWLSLFFLDGVEIQ